MPEIRITINQTTKSYTWNIPADPPAPEVSAPTFDY